MFVKINDNEYYKVTDAQNLAPFFIQVASAGDIWIFLSSIGGITAGRKNASGNIFPYTTDDNLSLDYNTGSKTIVKVGNNIWYPFEQNIKYNITRNIYKSCYCNSVIIEEVNHDLKLTYSYKYETSDKYGIIKTSNLTNNCDTNIIVEVLDGVQNLLPYGVNQELQNSRSNLVDAYKAAELEVDMLAIYSLTTTINDTPNPIEMLKANIAYTTLQGADVYLNPQIINKFVNNLDYDIDKEAYGTKCGYFVVYETTLKSNIEYSFVLDVGYDHSKIGETLEFITIGDFSDIYTDIRQGTADIINIVRKADGIQQSADKVACATHYVNTLYNVMRGGIFEDGYTFNYDDFYKFIATRNTQALELTDILAQIKTCETIEQLKSIAMQNAIMHRLALEYLPLTFSRRHGDPSRPWNKFNIDIKDENGNKKISYEGNWRDIYQNWEALGLSYPAYYENMVAKFVNASTIDGFNPYRINNEGIDWEKPEPDDPFSGLGYWGDHQTIYLLRLLQGLDNHFPDTLQQLMSKEIFSYANVPYILKPYACILQDPKNTLIFDADKDLAIENHIASFGTDAKLLIKNNEVVMVSLAEKLLVSVLSKISNLLVGGGIWMNTQRPEWNDANNAIVGIGLSMITVYHINAYLNFISKLFIELTYTISAEVVDWLLETKKALKKYEANYKGNEKALLDELGEAFCNYRAQVYKNGFEQKVVISATQIIDWINTAKEAIVYTINQNSGETYVSYNLLKDDFTFTPMRHMLEGQSAIIGSGYLNSAQTCELLKSMKKSLYNERTRAHMLYPINMTKRFREKNCINSDIGVIDGIT
ncbi:MAG: hypothetical protein ATN33_04965, partial [Epulopiscium sp. Nele67-Bin001]